MSDDLERSDEEEELDLLADLSFVGWSVADTSTRSDGVLVRYRYNATSDYSGVVTREMFGKTCSDAHRALLDDVAKEREGGSK